MYQKSKASLLCLALALTALLSACAKDKTETPSSPSAISGQASQPSASPSPADSPKASSPSPEQPKTDVETLKNETGKTMIKSVSAKGNNHMSFAIVSKQGTVIVADPNEIPSPNGILQADIITSSFVNHSHRDPMYTMDNPQAKVSEMTVESFAVKDVKVTGVAASQSSDPVQEDSPTNVIYVYEVDGLRIAYIGGLGQDELTETQVKQLGKLDIVLTYFNDAPTWNIKKGTTIKVLQQLKPRIVLPTEYKPEVSKEILQELGAPEWKTMDSLAVDKADLDAMTDTEYVFLNETL